MELIDFCAEHKTKYDLTKPFKVGDRIVATTGHIIAWKNNDNTIKEFSENAPQVEEKWFIDFTPTEEIPEINLEIVKCTICENGTIKASSVKCETCRGSCYEECGECGKDKECEDCEGTGISENAEDRECEDCDGKGNVDLSKPAEILGHKFNASRVFKLKEAGAKVQILNNSISSYEVVLGFKVNDLTGFVLPMVVT